MWAIHITFKKIILLDGSTFDALLKSDGKVFSFLSHLYSSSFMRVTLDILAAIDNVIANVKSLTHPRM